MAGAQFQDGRQWHWLRRNHLTRMPHRWIVMDSEAHRRADAFGETMTFRLAVARRWHDDNGRIIKTETQVHDDPNRLWEFISAHTRPGASTVLWCHNLDFDLQNTDAFRILPTLGWKLEWANLDEQVSMAKWSRDGASLKMADTMSWVPKPLEVIGQTLGIGKPDLPKEDDSRAAWERRCVADVEITTCLVRTLLDYIRENELGNMQFSGAGMGYAMWRHKYLDDKVLVHADPAAIEAERAAMHTGRAEVWRHGKYPKTKLYEWDMANAYTRIAKDSDLPRQLIKEDPDPTMGRYKRWAQKWALLAKAEITTDVPCVPVREDSRELWPVGTFTTWLWDCELQLAIEEGATVRLVHVYAYLRGPIMARWAAHTLDVLHGTHPEIPDVVKLWYKHQARATIGRCGLRYTQWEPSGPDWIGMTGISTVTTQANPEPHRLLHIGGELWEESGKVEGRDSMPMIPSWIAARCRVILWRTMRMIGLQHVYYVDTDSILVDAAGHDLMEAYAGGRNPDGWRVKGIYRRAELYGPRQIILEWEPRIAGVPKRAERTEHATFEGHIWQRAAAGLAAQAHGSIRVSNRTWHPQWSDRRRRHLDDGTTAAVRLPVESEHGAGPHSSSERKAPLPAA